MAGIPLVNSNDVNDINTSIIAIKKEINSVGNTEVNVTLNMPENSIPVDTVASGNMHAVTSNAVAEAVSFTATEKISGNYFDNIRYHKTYIFSGINLVANTSYVLSSSFDIPYNKTVGIKGFIINGEVWSNDIKAYILSNGTLAVQSSLAGNNFTVILDVYYIK